MKEKYVDVRGIRTRYLEAGIGEPLMLVHGGHFGDIGGADGWDLVIDRFAAESFHVFAIDKIGQGFTDNPKRDEDYVIGTTVQHAYDFLKVMKISGAHVAGISRGGYCVCRLALEHPEVVKTLIILDSATLMIPPNPFYDEVNKQVVLVEDPRERIRLRTAANSFRSEHVTDDYLDRQIEMEALPKRKEAEAKMRRFPAPGEANDGLFVQFKTDLIARQKETHEWIRAGGIKAPTLIVWAFNDPSAKFDPIGLDTIRLILPSTPNSQVHILNEAGHPCYREQPKAFVAAVTSFIKLNWEGK